MCVGTAWSRIITATRSGEVGPVIGVHVPLRGCSDPTRSPRHVGGPLRLLIRAQARRAAPRPAPSALWPRLLPVVTVGVLSAASEVDVEWVRR